MLVRMPFFVQNASYLYLIKTVLINPLFKCQQFKSVRTYFPDELKDDGNYNFLYDGQHFKKYCNNNSCDNNLEQINSACLHLFNALFGDHNAFKDNSKNNIDVVYYIIIWLSYMLSLKENGINKLNDFYTKHIEKNTHYTNTIYGVSAYNCYKKIIDQKKDLLDMNNNIISNFYKAFKSLCEMYSTFGGNTSNCKKISDKANQFFEEYKELNNYSDITKGRPYYKLLSTLSNDYDNLKNICKDAQGSKFPTLPEINTPKDTIKIPEETSEQKFEQKSATNSAQNYDIRSSSSSIVSKLIPVVSIFVAISIFLGISYKYSLFGFRKRSQKHLREKLKK
ncbi:PIR protein [Plasmodium yoelii yoelii]|uniref:PIR protein n=1 Tax=Plasmodium yoelii yoelii TaxID=73239 RepID=A0AAE9WP61_PLAYO|nr:PIR protein [Plasmodium yoelii yoelii]